MLTLPQIIDTHSDHSGNVTASDKGQSASSAVAEEAAEVEQMLEAEAEYLESQLEAAVEAMTGGQGSSSTSRRRQEAVGRRIKIDEQVLVGEGAPL